MNKIKYVILALVASFVLNTSYAGNWCGTSLLYQYESGHGENFKAKQDNLNKAITNCHLPENSSLNLQLKYWSAQCGLSNQKSGKATDATKMACNEGAACQTAKVSGTPSCFTSTINNSNITCTARTTGYHFDTTTNTCRTCEGSTILNTTTNTCDPCPAPTVYSRGACVACPAPSVYNATNSSCSACPTATPYYDSTTTPPGCRACTAPTVYNAATSTCEACPSPTVYNDSSRTCAACPAPTVYNPTTKTCAECNAPTTYNAASKACEACPSPTVYNSTTKSCEACTSPNVYNAATKSCEACPAPLVYTNGACASCSGQTPYYNPDTKACLSDAGKSCLQKHNKGNTALTLNYLKSEVIRLNRSISISRMSGARINPNIPADLDDKSACCMSVNNGIVCPTK